MHAKYLKKAVAILTLTNAAPIVPGIKTNKSENIYDEKNTSAYEYGREIISENFLFLISLPSMFVKNKNTKNNDKNEILSGITNRKNNENKNILPLFSVNSF